MLPESHLDLLSDEKPSLAYLATTMPDGSPQVTPIWFSYSNGELWINTRTGRVKEKNMSARPQVALVIQDPSETYRFLQIRGEASGPIQDGAVEHIDRLSHKYDGKPFRSLLPNEGRVIFKIDPRSVSVEE
ncbi:MAG: PPOX class F420-dependent oxidoreductase [Anaerolineales bacterium]